MWRVLSVILVLCLAACGEPGPYDVELTKKEAKALNDQASSRGVRNRWANRAFDLGFPKDDRPIVVSARFMQMRVVRSGDHQFAVVRDNRRPKQDGSDVDLSPQVASKVQARLGCIAGRVWRKDGSDKAPTKYAVHISC